MFGGSDTSSFSLFFLFISFLPNFIVTFLISQSIFYCSSVSFIHQSARLFFLIDRIYFNQWRRELYRWMVRQLYRVIFQCLFSKILVDLIFNPVKAPVRPAPPPPLNIAKVNTSHVQHAVPVSSRYSRYFLCFYIAWRQKSSYFLFVLVICSVTEDLTALAKCAYLTPFSYMSYIFKLLLKIYNPKAVTLQITLHLFVIQY